jgi:hypothetical protein
VRAIEGFRHELRDAPTEREGRAQFGNRKQCGRPQCFLLNLAHKGVQREFSPQVCCRKVYLGRRGLKKNYICFEGKHYGRSASTLAGLSCYAALSCKYIINNGKFIMKSIVSTHVVESAIPRGFSCGEHSFIDNYSPKSSSFSSSSVAAMPAAFSARIFLMRANSRVFPVRSKRAMMPSIFSE